MLSDSLAIWNLYLTEALSRSEVEGRLNNLGLQYNQTDQALLMLAFHNTYSNLNEYNFLKRFFGDAFNRLPWGQVILDSGKHPRIDTDKIQRIIDNKDSISDAKSFISILGSGNIASKKSDIVGNVEVLNKLKESGLENIYPLVKYIKSANGLDGFIKTYIGSSVTVKDKFKGIDKRNVKDFNELKHLLDSLISSELDPKLVSTTVTLDDLRRNAVYKDEENDIYIICTVKDDIKATEAMNIKFGQGNRFGLCISTKSEDNYTEDYRIESFMTTYFVYKRIKSVEERENINKYDVCLIDAISDRNNNNVASYSFNYCHKDGRVSNIDSESSISKISELLGVDVNILKEYIKVVPFSECELKILKKNLDEIELSKFFDINYNIEARDAEKFIRRCLNIEGCKDVIKEKFLKYYKNSMEEDGYKYVIVRDFIHIDVDESLDFSGIKCEGNYTFIGKDLKRVSKKIYGNFDCDHNELTSLVGAPTYVTGNFDCSNNNLTTLEGSPKNVMGAFVCTYNKLKTLKGAPIRVGSFHCDLNNLKTLEYAPKYVGRDFTCNYNKLETLNGSPKYISNDFSCDNNKILKTLDGAPMYVGGTFNCHRNNLESLNGAPKMVGGSFGCRDNNLKNLLHSPQIIGSNLDARNNPLESYEGVPKEVGGLFLTDKELSLVNRELDRNRAPQEDSQKSKSLGEQLKREIATKIFTEIEKAGLTMKESFNTFKKFFNSFL